MDQASSLRELMIQLQQNKTTSVAVLSTSDVEEVQAFVPFFVEEMVQKMKKKTTLLGVDEKGKKLEDVVKGSAKIEEVTEKKDAHLQVVHGPLDFLSAIRNNTPLMKKMIEEIKQLEKETELLFYYAGKGLDPIPINLSLLSNNVILVMKPTIKSYMETTKIVKIFSKMKPESTIGVWIDTEEKEIFEEQIKKIQDFCWAEFKYNIEPVGFCKTKANEIEESISLSYLFKKKETKTFSESISTMAF